MPYTSGPQKKLLVTLRFHLSVYFHRGYHFQEYLTSILKEGFSKDTLAMSGVQDWNTTHVLSGHGMKSPECSVYGHVRQEPKR